MLALRAGKGMVLDPDDYDTWSAGSFFTNPIIDPAAAEPAAGRGPAVLPAGRDDQDQRGVVDRGGRLRPGLRIGPARLSEQAHVGLDQPRHRRAVDVLALAREIRAGVEAAYGITLVPEPMLIGCAL